MGNTCFASVLLQFYYSFPGFVELIYTFKDHQNPGKDDIETRQIRSGCKVILELQVLFAMMQSGIQSYVDPSEVLHAIVDEMGDKFRYGEE